jgi:hypothetical protein
MALRADRDAGSMPVGPNFALKLRDLQRVDVKRGRLMGLWLLSFTQREIAVIVEAETLAHARLLAAANQICRASLFDEGVAIKASFRDRIPADVIGRALSQDETADLLSMLTLGASEEAVSDQIETAAA